MSMRGEVVFLRSVTDDDATRLVAILTCPGVTEWWPRHDLRRVQEEMIGCTDETVALVIEVENEVIGLIQYWEENEPDYRHAGIDIAVHPAWHGKGLGADALRTVAWRLFENRGHHRIVIDPAAHNERAIRSYGRVGFRVVGVMRRYERGVDGTWHDSLLMDLLPEELQ